MSSTLALASAIAGMDRSALTTLALQRRPQAIAGVIDPIGFASELLRPESIARAIAPLDRHEIGALLQAASAADTIPAEQVAALTSLGLLGKEGDSVVPLAEVTEALRDALDAASSDASDESVAEHRCQAEAAAERHPVDTGAWYSPALTAVGEATEILRVLHDRPGRLNRNGLVAVATIRGMADSTGIDFEHTRRTLEALHLARLTTTAGHEQALIPSATAATWAALSHHVRWLSLADAALVSLPPAVQATLRAKAPEPASGAPALGADLVAAVASLPVEFPLLPESSLAAADEFVALAEYLGLTVQGWFTAPALALLTGDRAQAAAAVERDFPGIAPGIYVQPDLSVVVPGPLSAADENELASVSRPEHIGVASTRRITEASIAEAFDRGRSESDIRSMFERVSLTGIPQPLEYLISSLAARIGDIVVDEHHGDAGRTRITVSRPELAETLRVDRALQHLQLKPVDASLDARPRNAAGAGSGGRETGSGVTLVSRLRIEHVLAALTDARYPATSAASSARVPSARIPSAAGSGAASASSTTTKPSAHPVSDPAAERAEQSASSADSSDAGSSTPEALDPDQPDSLRPAASQEDVPQELADLVQRVYLAARSDPGAGDFTRRLELAIRDRSAVKVTASAGGQTRVFVLLPVSLSGGRLRATDQAAGVERTLPVNLITEVEPA